MQIGEHNSEPSEARPAPQTIVVAGHDRLNLKTIQTLLSEQGYYVHAVADDRPCLEQVVQAAPDLILMDLGASTIQTCRQLKAIDTMQSVPLLFMTTGTDDDTLQVGLDAGGCDVVRKPISRIEVLVRVRAALSHRRTLDRWGDAQKLQEALKAAGEVCHELNQPLQYVLGALQLLMLDIAETDPVYAKMQTIAGRVEQMGNITRHLTQITGYRSAHLG